jgi:N-methylhydantoinase B
VKLAPGEFVVSHSAGGGGYGSPLQRAPERVLHDVREGWVTSKRARDVYGVVMFRQEQELFVDEAATGALRRRLAS